ncbi:TonB-dependent siderophore receptor [Microbulbifer sp.]|uniref:TonB-dependent siderophore receptor n=1 Tax=Microbulbifer sp. TaxID=1908541 RepID=UPI00258DC3FB|nr:TonB-dependent siderophore receptor [Microbulbifer sp.]
MSTPPRLSKTLLSCATSTALWLSVAQQSLAQEAPSAIEEISVTAQKQAYRGDIPLESLPQQTQVLSGDTLAELGAVELQDALDIAGGVARQNNFGGLWDSFAIRGFAGDENLPSGYLVNGFSGGRGFSGNRDASNIETIEILKGPGSALFGRGEPGGTINIVTRKPGFEREGEGYLRATAGRYDTYRVEGDYTDTLNDRVAFRINGARQDGESFRDTVESEKTVLTPSFLVALAENTSLSYEAEYLKQATTFDRGIVAIDGDPGKVPLSNFYGEPGDGPSEVNASGHQLVLQHDLNDDWFILAGANYRASSFEDCVTEAELAAPRQPLYVDGQTLSRWQRCRDFDAEDTSARIELSGSFETGAFTHHMIVGGDTYEYALESLQDRWRVAPGDTTYSVDVFNPVHGQVAPDRSPMANRQEEQSAWGLYVQDQVDLGEHWKLLLGMRYDDFSQDIDNRLSGTKNHQSQTATSPRAGLVYEASDTLSVYASYSEGFSPNSGVDFFGTAFDPEESKSYEVGTKLLALDGALSSTIALFKMEKSNIVAADPAHPGSSAALGEAESQGVEIDITGDLTDTVRLLLNYAYVDAKTGNDITNADWGVDVPAGSPLINIPENSANLLLVNSFTLGGKGSTFGIGVNYVDDRLGETVDPSYILPSYTLVKLLGSYQATGKLKLTMNVDNLLDEEYYASSYHKLWTMPGAPLTWTLGATYSL